MIETTLNELITVVSTYYNLNNKDLTGKSRKQHIANARQVYFYLARKYTKETLSEIGAKVNRGHDTALHGIRMISNLKEIYSETNDELILIEQSIENPIIAKNIDLLAMCKSFAYEKNN
jgi:chromosomal replication initiation ATPase DnaA